ncbi:MAG TPA: 50S ribosomal protein L9 [Clostridiales bacterium]|nr:MAG: 50S ribosomal protein L9 [Clostridiales bacterium GWD2_32_19]HCC07448.1 50S ribosomal protein L9 [Clostridiales bacterium]
MKLILKKDVNKLGKLGDVIEASDGYARNYLLPQGLASEATKANMCELEQKKGADRKKEKEELDKAKNKAEILKSKIFKIIVKTGENGRVFGSVTTKEIAEVIKEQTGIDVDKRKIELADHIKSIGIYTVSVKLRPDVMVSVKVEVNGQ